TGTPDTDYGYWYSGEQNDGAAGGGFEPAPYGETWLNQPHSRGSWYYSCEIDLGYCGALRAAATVLSFDDKFGLFCFGGSLEQEGSTLKIMPRDGIRQRFGIVKDTGILNITLDRGHFSKEKPIVVDRDINKIILAIDTKDVGGEIGISISAVDTKYRVLDQKEKEIGLVDKDTKTFSINSDQDTKTIVLIRESN
ncbi:MAG TPA: DUF5695 domain-containing protein, partial [Clostridia bacterium]|nr:DUF5695 domain-containing protein [Clostridia bacterium]